MFWPLNFLGGFLENHKGGWNVSELFTKRKRRYISSLDSWVALDLVLDIILSLL